MQRQGEMSSGVNRSDATSGTASGSGQSNEARRLDVLTLPATDPRSITFTIPSTITDVVPTVRAFRRSRPDPDQETVNLRRQLAESHAREMLMESTMAERAAAYGRHERSEANAMLEAMQIEASASVARAEEVARHHEQVARNLMLEEQVRIARASEYECAVQTELASQRAMVAEAVTGREHAFAEIVAMNLRESQVVRDDRDKNEVAAMITQQMAEGYKAEIRHLTELSNAESSKMRQEMSEMKDVVSKLLSMAVPNERAASMPLLPELGGQKRQEQQMPGRIPGVHSQREVPDVQGAAAASSSAAAPTISMQLGGNGQNGQRNSHSAMSSGSANDAARMDYEDCRSVRSSSPAERRTSAQNVPNQNPSDAERPTSPSPSPMAASATRGTFACAAAGAQPEEPAEPWETTAEKMRIKEAEAIKLPPMPNALGFRAWKLQVWDEVAGASGNPDKAFQWLKKVEKEGTAIDDLASSGRFP